MDKKVYVTLQNGKVFEGYSFGAEREVIGELKPFRLSGITGSFPTIPKAKSVGSPPISCEKSAINRAISVAA